MKISVIGPTYPFRGGISHYNTLLCSHLAKKHDIKAISFKRLYPLPLYPGKTQRDFRSKKSIKIDAIYPIDVLNPVTWFKTFLYIKRNQPDLIIIHWWTPAFFLVFYLITLLARFIKINTLFICHNVIPHESRTIDKILTKLLLKNGSFFIVHSKKDYDNLKKLIPHSNVKQTNLPTFDVFKYEEIGQSDAKVRLGIEGNVILFFGFVREYKGLKYLIEAMPKVLKNIDTTLLIVGEFWEDKEKYIKQIEKLGITEMVKVIDEYVPNEEIGMYFSSADIVVLPYISATQSGIIQIAYSFNKPVITTNVGGLPDVVKVGVTGYTVEPANSEKLAEAIISYYTDQKRINFENMKAGFESFSWNNIVGIVEHLEEK